MSYDELELDTLGDRKTALFLIMSDTDPPSTSLSPCATASCSTSFAKRRTMCTAGGCRSMCAASLTSSPTSARYPTWKSWSPPSAAGKSRLLLLQAQSQLKGHLQGQRGYQSWATGHHLVFGRQGETTLKEIWPPCWARRPSTPTTSESRGGKLPTASTIKIGKDMPYLFVKSSVALNLS